MLDHLLVRIKPANKRDVHSQHGITIKKALGWHRVNADTAKLLAEERMSELDLDRSALVFDVCTEEEALGLVAAQTKVEEPAGTVEAPREVAVPTQRLGVPVGKQAMEPLPAKHQPGRGSPPRSAKHAGR